MDGEALKPAAPLTSAPPFYLREGAQPVAKRDVFEGEKGRNPQLAFPDTQTGGQMGSEPFFGGGE